MDGQAISETDLAQFVSMPNSPDARGLFLLGANNGRSDGTNGNPRIANETRSKSVTVNYFIKVNKACN